MNIQMENSWKGGKKIKNKILYFLIFSFVAFDADKCQLQ